MSPPPAPPEPPRPPGERAGAAASAASAPGGPADAARAADAAGPADAADPADPPAFTFGRYRVRRELGRGAAGVVYEAWQDDLRRRVALKLIPRAMLGDPAAGERFLHEARSAARVNHPGVVAIYEVGVEQGQHYLAMELVEGRSLQHLVARRPPPGEAARIVRDVARAVASLHEHGIVHRDLKPANVLLEPDGRPRVTDFGFALVRAAVGDTAAAADAPAAGTPGFMAPEQLSARYGPVGPRSDVFALGAVLHALLTGDPPHRGSTVLEVAMSTLERDLPLAARRGVPPDLYAICRRCLERDPAARYAGAAELAADLERWLRGDAPQAAPPGWLRRLASSFRRRRALSARLFALLAFALLTVVDYWLLGATPTAYFLHIIMVLGLLALASAGLELLGSRPRFARATRYLWSTLDSLGFAWVLLRGDVLRSPLIVLFPVIILAAGFWLETGIVVYATVLNMLVYGALASVQPQWLRVPAEQHLAVLTALIVAGVLVSMQVARTRALRDYARRR